MNRTIILAGAVLALSASTALAGGFSYGSTGGNRGSWSYTDGAAGGNSGIVGIGYGQTGSHSYAGTNNEANRYGAYGNAWSGNTSYFKGYGIGYATSGSSAVSGSGVGYGSGYKAGGIKIGY